MFQEIEKRHALFQLRSYHQNITSYLCKQTKHFVRAAYAFHKLQRLLLSDIGGSRLPQLIEKRYREISFQGYLTKKVLSITDQCWTFTVHVNE
jgi:hypothetical protein